MTTEQMNECRQQLATIATARNKLADVAAWLANNELLEGYVSHPTPARLALGIVSAIAILKYTEAQLLSYAYHRSPSNDN